jgi:hypothetical protein
MARDRQEAAVDGAIAAIGNIEKEKADQENIARDPIAMKSHYLALLTRGQSSSAVTLLPQIHALHQPT